jgi:protein ImuB
MLWLCITLPQLPLEALQCERSEQPTVVTALEGNVRSVVCCNPAADRVGLKPGLNFTTALSMLPEVIAFERRSSAEQAALERLATWAYQFSGTVILGEIFSDLQRARSTALWLEIGASLRLFGGFRKLIEELEAQLRTLFYSYQLGIAPTLEGSALLARTGVRVAITTPVALRARIENIGVHWLNLDPWMTQQLQTVGVRTVGLLVSLPRDGVAKRFGPEVCNYLDRLTGAAPDPRPTYRLPPKYHAHFEFEAEVRSTESLLFPLQRMLREFVGFLRARDTGVQRFNVRFIHRASHHDDTGAVTNISVGLSMPDRNSERFLALTRERLEHATLPSATIALQLSAEEFAMPTALHSDMLSGAAEQSEDFSHTLDRLTARLGEEQVHGVKAVADHRPEFTWAPITGMAADETARQRLAGYQLEWPDRPLWLLPEPKPLQSGAVPPLGAGAERIEGGWWDGGDVQRDYFIAHTPQGAALWIYRDASDGSWHLHGFWS